MARTALLLAAVLAALAVLIVDAGDHPVASPERDDAVARVTLPVGQSVRETAALVAQTGIRGSYVRAARRRPRSVPGLEGFAVPYGTRSLEGFLFPGTYSLVRPATARELVDAQIASFRKYVRTLDLRRGQGRRLTPYGVLIIASLIERETTVSTERRLVSAVIYNRLRRGIRLSIDATLRYHINHWTQPLRISNEQAQSAYNTLLHRGLPPTPIGNPGLASLKAAADPAHVDYLYYVLKPCGNGTHAFSASRAQFERDVAAYTQKRDELHGKDASRC